MHTLRGPLEPRKILSYARLGSFPHTAQTYLVHNVTHDKTTHSPRNPLTPPPPPAARCQDLHVLRGLLQKRESVLTKLERAELQRRASKEGREPKVWTGACCCLGQRVDAVAYLTEELSYYNTEVGQAGTQALAHDARRIGGGA